MERLTVLLSLRQGVPILLAFQQVELRRLR